MNLKKFNNCILEECSLFGLESYTKIDLEGFNLRKIDIAYSDWSNSILKDCNLTEADMKEADLSCANLENAILKSAILEGANLKNANLKNANLEGADLNDAILDGVRILKKDYKYIEKHIDINKIIIED